MVKNTLTVGRIEEGFVLDHIQAGRSMDIYKYLHLGLPRPPARSRPRRREHPDIPPRPRPPRR